MIFSYRNVIQNAAFGSFLILGFHYGVKIIYDSRIRKTKIYKRALEILHEHEQAVQHLEVPIKEGKIRIFNNTKDIKEFSIDLKGIKAKGRLYCECLRHESKNEFQISKLLLKLANDTNQSFVILENQPTVL